MKENKFDKKDDLNSRLNKLYGIEEMDSFVEEVHEKNIYQPNEKEINQIRKKLYAVLSIVVTVCGGMLFLLFNPAFKLVNGKDSNTVLNDGDIVEDNKEEEIDPLLINKLSPLINSYVYDSLIIDNLQMYKNETLNFSNMNNDYKMFMLLKTNDIKEYIETKFSDAYRYTCQEYNNIIIESDFIKDVSNKYFGEDVSANVTVSKFFYNGYLLTLTKNENYEVTCVDSYDKNINYYIASEIIDNIKTEDGIDIYQKVVFINKTGVYKDPLFSELITNDVNANYDNFFGNSNIYKYTFKKINEDYHLKSVELSKGSQ